MTARNRRRLDQLAAERVCQTCHGTGLAQPPEVTADGQRVDHAEVARAKLTSMLDRIRANRAAAPQAVDIEAHLGNVRGRGNGGDAA